MGAAKFSLYFYFCLPKSHTSRTMKQLFAIAIFLWAGCLAAQSAGILEDFGRLSDTEQRCRFLADSNITTFDKATYDALPALIARKKDDKAMFLWYLQYFRFSNHFGIHSIDEQHDIFNKMAQFAQQKGMKAEIVVTQMLAARDRHQDHNVSGEQEAYSTYLRSYEQIKELGFEQFKRYALDFILFSVGRNFYELGDTERALECLLAGEQHSTTKLSVVHTLILNLIETIYAGNRDYPHAMAYAQKIYDINYQLNPTQDTAHWETRFWQGLSSLNMANYLYETNQFQSCEQYANRGYELSKIGGNFNESPKVIAEFEALQVLLKIKLRLGKINEAEPLFQRMEQLKPHIGTGMESHYFKPIGLYENYTRYFEAKKDYTNAYRYLKLANALQDSLNRRNDKRKLWQTEMRVNADRYQAQISSAEANSRLQALLRNAAIVALLFFGIFAYIVYRRITHDNKIITRQKILLEKSLQEKETLLKEIHHRVKNNLQIISGLLEKQAGKTTDKMTRKLMKEGQNRIFSMALVHHNLYQSKDLNAIEIKSYLQMLTQHIRQSHHTDDVQVELLSDVDETTVNIDIAVPLGLMLNELITNAFKYAFKGRKEGTIKIVFRQQEARYIIRVEDNGCGLPEGWDQKNATTLGMNLVRGLTRQLDGQLNVESGNNGTVFEVLLPK